MPDVLLHDGVEGFLKMSAMTLLLEDVDKVNGLNDVRCAGLSHSS